MKSLSLAAILFVTALGCTKTKGPEASNMDNAAGSNTTAASSQPGTAAETSTPSQTSLAQGELGLFTVYFEFDSWTITSGSRETLAKVASALKTDSNVKIQVEGHCDERGSNEYNLALGERRARSVQEFLIGEGVTDSKLSTISYGEERPAAQGTGEGVWAKNRRAEFKRM